MKWIVLLLLTLSALSAGAQTPAIFTHPALTKSKNAAFGNLGPQLAKYDAAKTKDVDGTVTCFTPTGQPLLLETLTDILAKTPEEKEGIRQTLQNALTDYATGAEKAGMANDIAPALAYYITQNYAAFTGGTGISDGASEALLNQIRATLDTKAMRKMSNDDKQRLYEFCILTGGFTAALRDLGEQRKDKDLQKQARDMGGEGLKYILTIPPERVEITEQGLVARK